MHTSRNLEEWHVSSSIYFCAGGLSLYNPCDILVNAKLRRHVYTDCYSAEIHHVLKHVLKLIY